MRRELERLVQRQIRMYYEQAGLGEDVYSLSTEQEIVTEVIDADVPNLELVDLPGIVQNAPGDVPSQTLALTQQYLRSARHTLVLCVIEGTSERNIRNSAALRECREQQVPGEQVVVVLTKADLFIAMAAAEAATAVGSAPTALERFQSMISHPMHSFGFAPSAIVPVVNRTSASENESLLSSRRREREIFSAWTEREPELPVGIDKVERSLLGMLERYMARHWRANELARRCTRLCACPM